MLATEFAGIPACSLKVPDAGCDNGPLDEPGWFFGSGATVETRVAWRCDCSDVRAVFGVSFEPIAGFCILVSTDLGDASRAAPEVVAEGDWARFSLPDKAIAVESPTMTTAAAAKNKMDLRWIPT